MSNSAKWNLYDYMLGLNRASQRNDTLKLAKTSLIESLISSPIYQATATKNNVVQPIGATRIDTMKCTFMVLPGDSLYIGDIVGCFSENWLIMESKIDEYGLTTAVGWLCNHLFRFQNHSSIIYEQHGVIDDGTYSSRDKKIATAVGKYTAYMPIDNITSKIYVDKRFSVDTIVNSEGNSILEVYKTIWIDTKTQNVGTGSHVLKIELAKDVYNPQVDNLVLGICNYIAPTAPSPEIPGTKYACVIKGRGALRVGTARNYSAAVMDTDGKNPTGSIKYIWSTPSPLPAGITIVPSDNTCSISVELNDELIGYIVELTVKDVSDLYAPANKKVEVISIV